MGDAAGIGPEVVLKALDDKRIKRLADFVLIGNSFVLQKTAQVLGVGQIGGRNVALLDVGDISKLVFGRANSTYGKLALKCIDAGLGLIKCKKIDVLITAPVNKHTISRAGFHFTGHTEYLANSTKTKNFAMMLVAGALKVVLVTRHIALKDVAGTLTKDKIYQTIRLSAYALRRYFDIAHPRLGICGLNPHSGDRGIMGREEARIIQPVIKKAKRLATIAGPLPADTLFYFALQRKFDAVIAMYHDQGLIPLKMVALHQGVNLTLGLPFVRTSPDHGTGYDIAGKNKANPGSMIEAIKLAVRIGSRLKNRQRS